MRLFPLRASVGELLLADEPINEAGLALQVALLQLQLLNGGHVLRQPLLFSHSKAVLQRRLHEAISQSQRPSLRQG
ncbi:MAG: hypothetical protein K0S08_1824 [Gammaproteobacteria bacterium]|jgi:hypothetical protein|nr:hypothetical protein [Gammaproteobacteria bacterium]